jgi:hypothetical protein
MLLFLLRDSQRDGRYLIARGVDLVDGGRTAESVPGRTQVMWWRDARAALHPEDLHDLIRMSFADWCERRGL